jgi:hypothetical protein
MALRFEKLTAKGERERERERGDTDCRARRNVALGQMNRAEVPVRLRVPTVAQIQKIPVASRCSFFSEIGGP